MRPLLNCFQLGSTLHCLRLARRLTQSSFLCWARSSRVAAADAVEVAGHVAMRRGFFCWKYRLGVRSGVVRRPTGMAMLPMQSHQVPPQGPLISTKCGSADERRSIMSPMRVLRPVELAAESASVRGLGLVDLLKLLSISNLSGG